MSKHACRYTSKRPPAFSGAPLEAAHRSIVLTNRHKAWPLLFRLTAVDRIDWPEVFVRLLTELEISEISVIRMR